MSASEELEDTELHLAVRVRDVDGVREALENGFDPNQIGLFEWSAMHEASENGDEKILRILINHGGDCNKTDHLNGSSSLHYASVNGHLHCLELLISAGADMHMQNNLGETAPQLARGKECRRFFSKLGFDYKSLSVRFKDDEEAKCNSLRSTVASDKKSFNSRQFEHLFSESRLSKSISSIDSLTSFGSSILSDDENCSGYAVMTFQYNRKTSSLRVSVSDVVLTCLMPLGKTRNDSGLVMTMQGVIMNPENTGGVTLKASSENFKILSHGDEDNPVKDSGGVFETYWSGGCACIKFNSAYSIEFSNVTKEMVRDHEIEVLVCVRQRKGRLKNTVNWLPVATMQMPLRLAVKRLLKEKYEFQHCPVPGITKTSRQFEELTLDEIVIDATSIKSDSIINKHVSLRVHENDRSASDGNLQQVRSHDTVSSSPHSSVLILNDSDEFSLEEVKSHSVPASPEVQIKIPNSYKKPIKETKLHIPGNDETIHVRNKRR